MICYYCGKDVKIEGVVGRGESCPHCGADLKVCRNCVHHDPKLYNECRESRAERVLDKTKANYCEHFVPKSEGLGSGSIQSEKSKADALKAAAEALFKKK